MMISREKATYSPKQMTRKLGTQDGHRRIKIWMYTRQSVVAHVYQPRRVTGQYLVLSSLHSRNELFVRCVRVRYALMLLIGTVVVGWRKGGDIDVR